MLRPGWPEPQPGLSLAGKQVTWGGTLPSLPTGLCLRLKGCRGLPRHRPPAVSPASPLPPERLGRQWGASVAVTQHPVSG